MKQKKLLLLAAAVALMMVGCEPEQVVVPEPAPEPTPAGPEAPTSLIGTVWNYHLDEWQTYSGYNYHIIADYDLLFETESSGRKHSHNTPTEGIPAWDEYFGFYYTYDSLTHTGIMEDSSGVGMGMGVLIYDFHYDAEKDAILVYSSSSDTTVYTRVQ